MLARPPPLQQRTEEIFCRLEGRGDLERFRDERTARIPLGRRSTPDEQAVEWLAVDAPDYMTAERLNVSGGLDKDWAVTGTATGLVSRRAVPSPRPADAREGAAAPCGRLRRRVP